MGFIEILQVPMADCLVGASLVCGLVACAGWLHCFCHASRVWSRIGRAIAGM